MTPLADLSANLGLTFNSLGQLSLGSSFKLTGNQLAMGAIGGINKSSLLDSLALGAGNITFSPGQVAGASVTTVVPAGWLILLAVETLVLGLFIHSKTQKVNI